MSTTKTPFAKRSDDRVVELDSPIRASDCAVSDSVRSSSRHGLVASAEYEWTTPLNLPGLIVSADDSPSRAALSGIRAGVSDEDLIESEDGDVSSAFQFPGRLKDLAPRR